MSAAWTAVSLGLALLAVPGDASKPALTSRRDQVSYAMAVAVARSAQRQGVEIDVGIFAQGLDDALRGAKLRMTQDEMRRAIAGVVEELKGRQERSGPAAAGNRATP